MDHQWTIMVPKSLTSIGWTHPFPVSRQATAMWVYAQLAALQDIDFALSWRIPSWSMSWDYNGLHTLAFLNLSERLKLSDIFVVILCDKLRWLRDLHVISRKKSWVQWNSWQCRMQGKCILNHFQLWFQGKATQLVLYIFYGTDAWVAVNESKPHVHQHLPITNRFLIDQ